MKLALTLKDSNHYAQLGGLCACTAAIESVVENNEPLTQAMEEINRTSHDEYGAKAGGMLHPIDSVRKTLPLRRLDEVPLAKKHPLFEENKKVAQ